ncbi:MAG: 2-oxo-4-hydroxy-4-carboxy-5-ureidoimidazoline decarboxylase [Chloroflexi bacterium]|nr:2-oxo-4-hydroxy-4-carboxy-5-ureidoimidazoline decarboxylase [Chloroflexota bacterium]
MTAAHVAPLPPIERLDRIPAGIFAATIAPLFEGAPRFLERLANARPFGSLEVLFERARQIAHAMPLADQLELIDAHPRLGAPPAGVSALSFVEQGYGREPAEATARDGAADQDRVAAELVRLNAAYEDRFGFRYCVFVDGRTRAELLPGMAAALEAGRTNEISRALDAVIDIARDRAARLGTAAREVTP